MDSISLGSQRPYQAKRDEGQFVGVTQAVLQNQDGWFGEGDDMIFIDGDTTPTINGTGTEDYYNGAWDFGAEAFACMHQGAPYIVDPERIGGRYCLYRWHTESPIAFEKSIRVTIEHGHANHQSDNFYSTAFWYQTGPHAEFPRCRRLRRVCLRCSEFQETVAVRAALTSLTTSTTSTITVIVTPQSSVLAMLTSFLS